MKKVKVCLWIAFSLCFLWFPAYILVGVLRLGYMLLLGPQGDLCLVQQVLNVLALVSATALAVIHYRETPRALGNKFALGLLILGLVVLTAFSNIFFYIADETTHYRFTSPDKAHTIVVEEQRLLRSSGVAIYERVGPCLYKEEYCTPTDDDSQIFWGGEYQIDWREDGVEVTFGDGMGGRETISLELG